MKNFGSCHLIISRIPTMIVVLGFTFADYSLSGLHLQTLTFLIAIRVHVGKTLTKSPAKNAN